MYQHVSFFVQLLFYSIIMYTASLKMSEPIADGIVFGFIDISRAHPHANINRIVYVSTPDDCGGGSRVKLLQMTFYGLRGAP